MSSRQQKRSAKPREEYLQNLDARPVKVRYNADLNKSGLVTVTEVGGWGGGGGGGGGGGNGNGNCKVPDIQLTRLHHNYN